MNINLLLYFKLSQLASFYNVERGKMAFELPIEVVLKLTSYKSRLTLGEAFNYRRDKSR